MSIGRAQALALRENFLDTLGTEPPQGSLPVIYEILGMAAQDFIDNAAANLDRTGSVSTGDLASALTMDVEQTGDGYVLHVGYEKGSAAAKYYDFNNKGVQGVKKPGNAPGSPYKFRYLGVSPRHALALMRWYRHNGRGATQVRKPVSSLETKRVTLRDSVKAADSLKSLAYATAMAMKKEGLKPSRFFDDAIKASFGPELMEALSVALGGDVILHIRQYGDKN